jgi:acyl carrier protein
MSETEIRETVLRLLGEIAPEADPATLKPNVSLRDQVDIDSMDFLNLLIAIDAALGVDIPEADYPKLGTLGALIAYLLAKQPAAPTPQR